MSEWVSEQVSLAERMVTASKDKDSVNDVQCRRIQDNVKLFNREL